jgi:hypothetical protein
MATRNCVQANINLSPVQASEMLLVFASTAILDFGPPLGREMGVNCCWSSPADILGFEFCGTRDLLCCLTTLEVVRGFRVHQFIAQFLSATERRLLRHWSSPEQWLLLVRSPSGLMTICCLTDLGQFLYMWAHTRDYWPLSRLCTLSLCANSHEQSIQRRRMQVLGRGRNNLVKYTSCDETSN